ncbi:putative signal peptide peptidase SppA [compost metagenome]
MKDIGDPLRTMSKEEQEIYQDIVDVSYEQFVDVIAKGRKMTKDMVYKLADGRVYSGKKAKEIGLIDELGSLQDAVLYIQRQTNLSSYQIVQYTQKTSVFSKLNKGADVSSVVEKVQSMLGVNLDGGPRLMYLLN